MEMEEECKKPLLNEECVKRRVKEFISESEISIVVISAAVEETFVEMFNSAGVETEIICPEAEKLPNAEKFPNSSFIVMDAKRVMIVSGPLENHGWFRVVGEMRKIERVLQLFSELEEIFSIKL